MHVWRNYPPCIRRRNKECLPFNTTLVLRGFIPGFSVTLASTVARRAGQKQGGTCWQARQNQRGQGPCRNPSPAQLAQTAAA